MNVSRVVYHLVPTSNHNTPSTASIFLKLFIILFLHQTTTGLALFLISPALFIILFLHQTTTPSDVYFNHTLLFIILFLHQTTTIFQVNWVQKSCLSSCSYIKPQPTVFLVLSFRSCLSSCSYIKPQLDWITPAIGAGCLSSCSYIKPQRNSKRNLKAQVVYHLVPTSNHNCFYFSVFPCFVVYHLVPTSNHNTQTCNTAAFSLFIILFLHQTTTHKRATLLRFQLFIILFLHQTTTSFFIIKPLLSCLSSCSYIKPQLCIVGRYCPIVVYHLVPTSNHN